MNCVSGDEPKILRLNRHLIDTGFVETIGQVADLLAKEGDQNVADWLQNLAAEIAKYLNNPSPTITQEEYIEFLDQVLITTTRSDGDARAVYPLLQANLNKLDSVFANLLEAWATANLPKIHSEIAQSIAVDIGNFSDLIRLFPFGNRADNIEIAIVGYKIVLKIFTRALFPEQWANTQNKLGTAYSERIRGERVENLQTAIACFQQAIEEYNLLP